MAIGTLTVVPVPPPTRLDRRTAGGAMLLAPVAALFPAVLSLALIALADLVEAPALLTGIAVVGAWARGTRCMHLDGLADTVDGLGSSLDRTRVLEVMRSGDVGPMGAVTLILVLGAQVVAIAEIVASGVGTLAAALLIAGCLMVSRALLSRSCIATVPSARPDGLGAMVAGSVPSWAAAVWPFVLAGLLALGCVGTDVDVWVGPALVLGGYLAGEIMLRRTVAELGGITGDVLGAVVEVGLTASLVVLAVAL